MYRSQYWFLNCGSNPYIGSTFKTEKSCYQPWEESMFDNKCQVLKAFNGFFKYKKHCAKHIFKVFFYPNAPVIDPVNNVEQYKYWRWNPHGPCINVVNQSLLPFCQSHRHMLHLRSVISIKIWFFDIDTHSISSLRLDNFGHSINKIYN